MKMVAFRVENFRSVLDSGWIDTLDTTVIVGKNESGKTSVLRALWKFNPFTDDPYDLNREWPRGRRREMSLDKPVITVRFTFTEEEQHTLSLVGDSAKGLTGVEIQRDYGGTYTYQFLPNNPELEHKPNMVLNVIKKHFGNTTLLAFEHVKAGYRSVFDALRKSNRVATENSNVADCAAIPTRNAVETLLPGDASTFANRLQTLQAPISDTINELHANLPMRQAVEIVHRWLPTFIYMDDYKVFKGAAKIDQIKQRKDAERLTDEDRTIMKIMEMAGLSLDDEVRKSTLPDKEQRMLDMNDASQTLTAEIAHRWSQKKYEVLFQADGQHFITFVKDADTNILIPLEERSKGFQWFFSFDMTFMYETGGEFRNAIILLDEPGLHLHAAAQRDLLARLREYAAHNQLLYTTHLPFMIDFTSLENIYIAEDAGSEGTKVHQCWDQVEKDSRFTLQAALGLSWAQSLLTEQQTLLVEDLADYWFLSLFSTLLNEADRGGFAEDVIITPAGGATKIAYVGSLLSDEHMRFAVLLNSVPESHEAYKSLIQQWTMDDPHVFVIGSLLGCQHSCTIEDVFPEEYYLEQVNAVYRVKLGNTPLIVAHDQHRPVVQRVSDALLTKGFSEFNRHRVARRILQDYSTRGLSEIPTATVTKFEQIIKTLNTAFLVQIG